MSGEAILEKINEARARMSIPERRFWDAISIHPEKWHQHPHGDMGGGFWVVAIMGRTIIWFNGIEDGFNRSNYVQPGTIPGNEYWCDQLDLEWPVRALMRLIETGEQPAGRMGPPTPGEYIPDR